VASVDIFLPIISADQIEDGVLSFMEQWFEVYLKEIEIQTGRDCGSLPLPRSYQVWDKFNKYEEDQLPALIVTCPGLAGKPTARGDGSYIASWKMQACIIVSANDQTNTRRVSRLYGAALRALIVQKRSFGGIAVDAVWTGESYDLLSADANRTITAVCVDYTLAVDNVVNRQGGPRTYPEIAAPDPRCPPDGQPGSTWPDAHEVDVVIINEGV